MNINRNELTEMVDFALLGKRGQMTKQALSGPVFARSFLRLLGLGMLSSFLGGMTGFLRLIGGAIGRAGLIGGRAAENVGSFVGERAGKLLSEPELPEEYYHYPRVLMEYELAKSKLKNRLEKYHKQIFEDAEKNVGRDRR